MWVRMGPVGVSRVTYSSLMMIIFPLSIVGALEVFRKMILLLGRKLLVRMAASSGWHCGGR